MKAFRLRTAAAVLALAALPACGGKSADSGTGGGNGGCAGSGDIVIGVIAPQSGAVASLVGSFSQGAQQAASDINAKGGICGGRKLKVVTKDDGGPGGVDVSKDPQLAQQLVDQDHASGIVLVNDDDFKAAGSFLQSRHILTFGAFTGDDLDNPDNAVDTFSVAIPNSIERLQWKKYLLETKKVKRPAVLYETTTSYGRTQADAFCADAQAAGTPCVDRETVTLDTTDVTAQVGNMASKKADSILLEGFGIPVVRTVGTARAAGITGPILGTATTATSSNLVASFLSDQQRAGFAFVNNSTATLGEPRAATRLADELKQLGPITQPLFIPMFSYDSVRLMAKAWDQSGSLDADTASQAVEGFNIRVGDGTVYGHDAVYSNKHHIPQVEGWLSICAAVPLDTSGLAAPAPA